MGRGSQHSWTYDPIPTCDSDTSSLSSPWTRRYSRSYSRRDLLCWSRTRGGRHTVLSTLIRQGATAKLLLPYQDRGLIDARWYEKQVEAQLNFIVGRRKTPGAHPVK